MDNYIKPGKMLEVMRSTMASGRPRPFTIGYLLADKARKSGGEYRVLKCTLSSRGRRSGSIENRMINIEVYGIGEIKSVHIDNILYFNDQPVA